jgi:signal transduction histidine kinase
MNEKELKAGVENSTGTEKIKAILKYSEFFRQSDASKSIQLAEEARQFAQETGDVVNESNALVSQAYAFFYNSDFDSAQKILTELIQIGMQFKNDNALGTANNLKGRIALKSQNPLRALEFNLKALDYYLKDPRPGNLLSCYNNIGTCHQHQNQNEEALNYFQLALDEANKINHPAAQVILQNIGTIQYTQEKYDEALESYQKAVIFFEETNQLTNLANANYNIGLTYQKLGDYEKSLASFDTAYKLQEQINDPKGFSYTCNSIANSLIEMKKFDQAYELLEESYQIAKEHDLKWNLTTTSETFAKYWEAVGDLKQTVKYLRKVMVYTKELDQEINKAKLLEMEAKYKTKIYKHQSEKLDDENKVMSDQILTLQKSLHEQRLLFDSLQNEFQQAALKINEQDDLLSSQSRMAVMGEMISLISHQWRQPLNTIGVMVQSFQDAWNFDELTEEFINQQVEIAMDQIMYMSDTINDFRNFFKLEMSQIFNLKDSITKATKLFRFTMKENNIKLITELSCDCSVSGVPNDLVQVLLNILHNASQAMAIDHIQNPFIKIELYLNQNYASLHISNKGENISPEILAKLFEPYFTTKGDKGTGIGLYICRMIIENKFQGSLTAQNLPDGVNFSIQIPITTIDD